jgi:uncharacterized membrane protein YeaQ/YmgE (transglycosylase-associated protein family)
MITSLFIAQLTGVDPSATHGWLIRCALWIFIGAMIGFGAGKGFENSDEGVFRDLMLGILGAVTCGFSFSLIPMDSLISLISSVVVAGIGAIAAIIIYRRFTGGGRTV